MQRDTAHTHPGSCHAGRLGTGCAGRLGTGRAGRLGTGRAGHLGTGCAAGANPGRGAHSHPGLCTLGSRASRHSGSVVEVGALELQGTAGCLRTKALREAEGVQVQVGSGRALSHTLGNLEKAVQFQGTTCPGRRSP
jgi:hypothetical protein